MDKENLLKIITGLGIHPIDITDGWVRVSCPLSDVNHASKRDTRPSAGFSINPIGPSIFNCFVCGSRSLDSILHTFKWKRGIDLLKYYVKNEVQAIESAVTYPEKFIIRREAEPVPDFVLANFEPIKYALNFLRERGISLYEAERHNLMYCRNFKTKNGTTWKNAVVVPIRDTDFKTYWLHFRSIDSKVFWHGKNSHFGVSTEWGKDDSFFGMEHIDITRPVVVVEGAFDCLRLKTLGVDNVIATHGGVSHKSFKLKRLSSLNVVTGFDNDAAGIKFRHEANKFFGKEIPYLDWSIINVKDPGEIKSRQDLDKVLFKNTVSLKYTDKWRIKV
jgi:5S rRNA maturation endonuclease (ribonuclease M5)